MSFRWTTWATVTGGGRGAAFWELWLFLRLKGNFFSMLFVPVGREWGMKAMHRETRSHVQLGHRAGRAPRLWAWVPSHKQGWTHEGGTGLGATAVQGSAHEGDNGPGAIATAGLGMPVSPQGTDPHTSGTAGTCQMSARSPQGLLCKGQAPSQEEGGFRLAAGWLAVMLRQPTLVAARAEAAFGRWLLLAEGPFPVLFWSVAGRS